jgi:hypothetical protein
MTTCARTCVYQCDGKPIRPSTSGKLPRISNNLRSQLRSQPRIRNLCSRGNLCSLCTLDSHRKRGLLVPHSA